MILDNVSYSHKNKKPVFINKSFDFSDKGEIYLINGPNGIGKTTLLKLISNLIVPKTGKVEDQVYYSKSICFDDLGLVGYLSGEENIRQFSSLLSTETSNIDYYIERFSVREFLKVPVKKMSYGTQRKFSLILALIQKAEMYIFDEPLNGLDTQSTFNFIEDITNLKKRGSSIVLISHNIELVCDIKDFKIINI